MNKISINNIFSYNKNDITQENEFFENLLKEKSFKIERIISNGQQTAPNIWLEESTNEFVLLLEGNSKLKFYADNDLYNLNKGDWLIIPKNTKHRVEFTDKLTFWLTVHYE
ncbi:MAG TPA: hypothetical protein P5545_07320 [Bacteroidota bacterium]|nr:hypothetical protein [Bacteroidota bacterium]